MSVMSELSLFVEDQLSNGCSLERVAEAVAFEYCVSKETARNLVAPIADLYKEVEGLWS